MTDSRWDWDPEDRGDSWTGWNDSPGPAPDGNTWVGADRAAWQAEPRGAVWADATEQGAQPGTGRRTGLVWAAVAFAAVLALVVGGVFAYTSMSGGEDLEPATAWATTSAAPSASPAGDSSGGGGSAGVGEAEAAAADGQAPAPARASTTAVDRGLQNTPGSSASVPGDLGLSVAMTRPACDGRGIVVLYSAVTPGAYAQEISSALAQNPGASYLRTDQSCPSLRQRDEYGNVIYAVYRPSGYSRSELCADVAAAGGASYGRWLDTTSDPTVLVTC